MAKACCRVWAGRQRRPSALKARQGTVRAAAWYLPITRGAGLSLSPRARRQERKAVRAAEDGAEPRCRQRGLQAALPAQ